MNATKTDNLPMSDADLETLGYQDLMMAYLIRKLTPEQKQRAVEKLRTMKPVVA